MSGEYIHPGELGTLPPIVLVTVRGTGLWILQFTIHSHLAGNMNIQMDKESSHSEHIESKQPYSCFLQASVNNLIEHNVGAKVWAGLLAASYSVISSPV